MKETPIKAADCFIKAVYEKETKMHEFILKGQEEGLSPETFKQQVKKIESYLSNVKDLENLQEISWAILVHENEKHFYSIHGTKGQNTSGSDQKESSGTGNVKVFLNVLKIMGCPPKNKFFQDGTFVPGPLHNQDLQSSILGA